jgi:hypothetical protein
MIDKRIIDKFISRYHLGGTIEKIKWESNGESLQASFINDSQNLVGIIKQKDFKFPAGEFGIYSTSMLSKMLGILDTEIMFEIAKEQGKPARFIIADTNVDIKFNLADPQVIPTVPTINPTEGDIHLELDEEFIGRFIKSRDAVGEEVFYVSTQEGFVSKEVKFTIGSSSTNSISFAGKVEGGDGELNNIPFNALLVKEILKHNKQFELGWLKINPKGLMTFAFKFGDLEVNYYLVRNQNQ